ncbi:hypothetical protein BDW59DRAFT_165749 [Aspergillus cavernicola]|uniref:Uncharacterized protein n=1 Tax=Aspergillus cavernicola TaxID=176166 RepID=A0ABR4HR05_9EURO
MILELKPSKKSYCHNPATMCGFCRRKYNDLKTQIASNDLLLRQGTYSVTFRGSFCGAIPESYAEDIASALEQRLVDQFGQNRVHAFVITTENQSPDEGRPIEVYIMVDFESTVSLSEYLLHTMFRFFPGGVESWTYDEVPDGPDISALRLRWFSRKITYQPNLLL